ncbi:hypothetical protein BpHYR1_001473 [Brachionus plicatilis]|uniref:Uncharacterized protein n=1 Tax=Brachionus plicatilis TaxID=10195 RepID=A0A3M7PTB6_BRAPC|nr:hypothetical protein BpHYR1_001473 [Brachionus plicatilis]
MKKHFQDTSKVINNQWRLVSFVTHWLQYLSDLFLKLKKGEIIAIIIFQFEKKKIEKYILSANSFIPYVLEESIKDRLEKKIFKHLVFCFTFSLNSERPKHVLQIFYDSSSTFPLLFLGSLSIFPLGIVEKLLKGNVQRFDLKITSETSFCLRVL